MANPGKVDLYQFKGNFSVIKSEQSKSCYFNYYSNCDDFKLLLVLRANPTL